VKVAVGVTVAEITVVEVTPSVLVMVGVKVAVGVTVAEITVVEVTPSVLVMTTVTLTLSGVGVKVGMGRWVGVGGSVAVGVAVLWGGATLVGMGVGLAVNVGGISRAVSVTRRERRRKLPMPKQYSSSATMVRTVSALYSLFCGTVSRVYRRKRPLMKTSGDRRKKGLTLSSASSPD